MVKFISVFKPLMFAVYSVLQVKFMSSHGFWFLEYKVLLFVPSYLGYQFI